MHVSVETTAELERKMTVQFQEDVIKEKVAAQLKKLAKDVRIQGFRPGKVPQRIIHNRFGKKVREEVLGELIKSSFYQALTEKKLAMVGSPEITPELLADGEGFKYTASFEVYPEIELAKMEEIEITRPLSEVADTDLEAMIEQLRTQKKIWTTVQRPAQTEDRVAINFKGVANGEDLTEGQIKDQHLVLGKKTMYAGFEDKLIGAEAGQLINFELDFPTDYHVEKLAGKLADFEVEILKVEESKLPDVDEAFIKEFGIEGGDIETFRGVLKANMEQELNNTIRGKVKTAVMDALSNKHDIHLPKVLIDQEIKQLVEQNKKTAKTHTIEHPISEEIVEQQAVRRVKLGLILRAVIQQNDLKPDKKRVRSTIESMARSYQDPTDVINWYYADSNSEQLSQIEQMVLEDQVVNCLLNQVKITEQPISFSELMKVGAE